MFSATSAAFEGFRLAGRRPFLMLFWAIAYTVAIAVIMFAMIGAIAPWMFQALLEGPGALQTLPHEPKINFVGFAIAFPVFFVAVVLLSVMSITAVYRAVLRPKERGFGYLRIGGDEGRQILLILLIFVVEIVAIVGAAVLVTTAVAFTPQAWQALAGVAGVVVSVVLLIWVAVRLSLASAQTFDERRVTLFGSWALTRGRFWPLLGMWLLSFVLTLIVAMVVMALSYLPMLFAPGGIKLLGPHPWPHTGSPPLSAILIAAMVLQGLIQMIGAVLQVVVQTVPGAAAYAQLKPAPAA